MKFRLVPVLSCIAFWLLLFTPKIWASSGTVVISEIQITGATASDEFVELYNKADQPIDLSGWRLTRKTASGSETTLVNALSGIIPSHGFFLIAHPDYDGAIPADMVYSAPSNKVSANNSVALYADASQTLVDLVGMGEATSVEAAAAPNPEGEGSSIERKATSLSTSDSMNDGGAEANQGNGFDSDNNGTDFVLRNEAGPQNSSSPIETPTDTEEPLPTAQPTPLPTPTLDPTPTPQPEPTPTLVPEPEPTPITIPTPKPTKKPWHPFTKVSIVCESRPMTFMIWGRKIIFPHRICRPLYER